MVFPARRDISAASSGSVQCVGLVAGQLVDVPLVPIAGQRDGRRLGVIGAWGAQNFAAAGAAEERTAGNRTGGEPLVRGISRVETPIARDLSERVESSLTAGAGLLGGSLAMLIGRPSRHRGPRRFHGIDPGHFPGS
jgi:hypothetical protein